MIYGVNYNIERNEIYTFEAGKLAELKIACSAPVWFVDEGVRVLIMGVEAESLEEANRIAADKICKYFGRKREEALEEAAKYTLEVSKYEKLERAVKYAEYIVGGKKKIYSVYYFAEDGGTLSVKELPDEDNQPVCDEVYRTKELMYEVFVKVADEKGAKIKGAEAIAKFIERERVAAGKAWGAVHEREMKLRDMRVWLENKAEELRRV